MRISDGSSDVCSSDLLEKFRDAVEAEYQRILGSDEAGTLKLLPEDIDYMRSFFPKPAYRPVEQVGTDLAAQAAQEPAFSAWIRSEQRRVGQECVRKCQSRLSPVH